MYCPLLVTSPTVSDTNQVRSMTGNISIPELHRQICNESTSQLKISNGSLFECNEMRNEMKFWQKWVARIVTS